MTDPSLHALDTGTEGESVEVVVPTYNNLPELRRCLDSLDRQSHRNLRVFVCIDGSTDGTLEHLAARFGSGSSSVRVLTHPGNEHRGLAATRNLPLDVLAGDYVWYLDSDMVPDRQALDEHLTLLAERPCTSQGQVEYANADDTVWAGYLNTRAHHRSADREVLPFTWFSAANCVVRTQHVRALRGFDPRFVGYGGEEFDFAYRLQQVADEPLLNNKRAVATTIEHKAIGVALRQLESYGASNLHLLEALHPEMPRTFELQRLGSRGIRDRLFVMSVNPLTDRLADGVIAVGPRSLRNMALNYKVISAVWRGYRHKASGS